MMKHLQRRKFLGGLGGACVAAPFLSSVAERASKAQGVVAATPKRLIVMFTHFGCLTTKFFPESSHGPLSAADIEPTTLRGLAPYVDKLLLPRGIRGMNEWTSGLERGQGNDPHTQVVGSFFTCQPVTPNSDNPFNFDAATKAQAMPIGPSLDHVIAQQLSPSGIPLFMRIGDVGVRPSSAISYSAAEEPFPGLGEPTQIYSSLTGLFMDGAAMSPDDYLAVKGQSIIDLVKDDLETLERFDMSQADKLKLAAWKELLHETGSVMASAQCNEELAAALGADIDGGAMGNGDAVTTKITDTLDAADIYSNLAVLAAACDTNTVIFLKYPGNYVYSGLGITLESHSASHRLNNANMSGTCVEGVLDILTTIDEYYASKFSHLVGQLDSINEGDGTLLDNSAAIWFNEMSDGNAHNLNNLPIVQVGSLGGYFKTGQSVNVWDGSASLQRGNSEAQCNGNGNNQVDGASQSTGTPAELASAPINKYFVTLMNALGVKAGAEGFPEVGGTADVTHYGRYDRTEDFVGGDANPPNISDPGPFDELKANT